MTPEIEERILAHLDRIAEGTKRFDGPAEWRSTDGSGRAKHLFFRVGVRVNNVLGGGVSIFITTPENAWETDVYGHIEVRFPQMQRNARIHPLEWRPQRYHTNPPDCGPVHSYRRLKDRWHPYELNRERGVACLSQGARPGLAVEPPRAISTFKEYLEVAASLWRCPDLYDLPRPAWTRNLFE